MAISGRNCIKASVPVFLAAQVLMVRLIGGVERLPKPPDPAGFPPPAAGWTQLTDDPIGQDVLAALKADRVVSRVYRDGAGPVAVGLFVAWFQSQRGGERQPHSPKVCLPGSGWEPRETADITLRTSAGPITVNRMVLANGQGRSVFLYWYQTPRRVVSGEWMAKLWLVADAFRDRRTDAALVRIDVNAAAIGDEKASAAAVRFAQDFYPRLREWLPR